MSIRSMGIPFFSGYARQVAASFRAALMSLSVTSAPVLCSKNVDRFVYQLLFMFFLIWQYRRPNALIASKMGSPFHSWWMQTFFQPFFCCSSRSVAPSANNISQSGASRGSMRSSPALFFLKKRTSFILNCTVCFVAFLVPLDVYSPIRSR